ncbi:MAG: hypothetical protein ACP5Q3_15925, partial [bacterium]
RRGKLIFLGRGGELFLGLVSQGRLVPAVLCGKKVVKYKDVNSQPILISPRLLPPEAGLKHIKLFA